MTCIYGISGVQTTAAVARALQGMQIQTRNGAWPWPGTATQPLNMGGIPDISLGAQDYLAVAPTVALMNEAWNCVITNNDVAASQVFMYLRGVQLFTPGGGF